MRRDHVLASLALLAALGGCTRSATPAQLAAVAPPDPAAGDPCRSSDEALQFAQQMIAEGRRIFRYETFGDEGFWTGKLGMPQAVSALPPRTALDLGLKVDAEALRPNVLERLKHGKVNLDDPAVTVELVREKAVLGVVGTFDSQRQ